MKSTEKPIKKASFIKNIPLAVYGLFSSAVALTTIYFIYLSYHVGPFRDMWIAMDFIRATTEGNFTITDLFSLHGGAHRLAIPRLFFLIEYNLFAGSNIFLIVCSVAAQSSVVWLMWKVLQQEYHMSLRYQLFLTAMTLLLMFNATQLENFIYTFDMQWFVTSASAIWALYFWNTLFKNLSEQKKFLVNIFIASLLTTLVSMLSSFSGLCILLVLPLLAVVYRLSFKPVAILMIVVIMVIASYMSGPFGEGGDWGAGDQVTTIPHYLHLLLNTALLWVKWVALYFGAPLSREYFWLAAVFAYGSLLCLAWQWYQLMNKGVFIYTPFQVFSLSVALFAACVGISTGLGRMYFVNTANEDRYQSIVLIYWLGVFAFFLSRALQIEMQQNISRYKHMMVAMILFWTGIIIPIASIKNAQAQVNFFDRVNNVNLAIATGQWDYNEIKDTLILGDKWKKINRPEKHATFLRDQQWGVFHSAEYGLLGKYVDRGGLSVDRCEGAVDVITPVNGPHEGYRITGHGQNVFSESLLKNYIAIDEAGQVVGLGRLQRRKDSLMPISWQPVDQAHWVLYTTALDSPQTLQILGLLDTGGAYCVMASAKLPGHNRRIKG